MGTIVIKKGMDVNGINAAIKSIQGRGAKLDSDIQLTGLSILAHIAQHKEVSLFKKLFDALPQGSRRLALVKWAVDLGQVKVNQDKKTSKEQPFLYNKDKETSLDKAEQYPWFTYKPEATPREAFNLESSIKAFQEMLAKQIKAGKVDAHDRRIEILMAVTPELPAVANDEEERSVEQVA